ncbi:MAG: molybdopterin-guanine dinucleotide biosynthesis protein B [Candidatus Thermoplasmatota archaeon]|nr:molybdopterin-guanine dinucleotide biosynthesis protein B [Candidatus Thermoplasmatota archaeon]
MNTPSVFGVYGVSSTGKTTVLVQLITQLSEEGYRVATVKQTNKAISMDVERKDTRRHRQAGASLVVFSSLCETNFLLSTRQSTPEILQKISAFGEFDVILIEGADDPDVPKIQIGSGKKRPNTVCVFKNNVEELLSLIKEGVYRKHSDNHLYIRVNGKEVPLSPFPAQIISNTILGMLRSLKEVDDINEVTIELHQA